MSEYFENGKPTEKANKEYDRVFKGTQPTKAPTIEEIVKYTVGSFKPQDVPDYVNHPSHYTKHPSGIECIQITEWMSFNLGNSLKYIWRADLKGNALEDLKKARWYLDREIAKREKHAY